jgi:hypothetical protein
MQEHPSGGTSATSNGSDCSLQVYSPMLSSMQLFGLPQSKVSPDILPDLSLFAYCLHRLEVALSSLYLTLYMLASSRDHGGVSCYSIYQTNPDGVFTMGTLFSAAAPQTL